MTSITANDFPSFVASEKGEGNESTTQPEPVQNSPTPQTKKELGNCSPNILKDVNVPAVILVSFILDFYSSPISHNFF